MRTPRAVRSRLDRLVKRQTLDDSAQFTRGAFFGELPFYSRYQEIAFLEEFGREVSDRLLVAYGLDYLDKLLDELAPAEPFLAALTIDRAGRSTPLVPHVFVSHGEATKTLPGHLSLRAPSTVLARYVERLVGSFDDTVRFQVLEDFLTVPRHPRVFVGPRWSAAPAWVTIEALQDQARQIALASP